MDSSDCSCSCSDDCYGDDGEEESYDDSEDEGEEYYGDGGDQGDAEDDEEDDDYAEDEGEEYYVDDGEEDGDGGEEYHGNPEGGGEEEYYSDDGEKECEGNAEEDKYYGGYGEEEWEDNADGDNVFHGDHSVIQNREGGEGEGEDSADTGEDDVKPVNLDFHDMLSYGHKPWNLEYGKEKKALKEAFTGPSSRKDYVKPVQLSSHDMLAYGHKPWDPDYGQEKKALEEAFTEAARHKSSRKDSGKEKSSRKDYVKPVKLSFRDMLSYGHKPGDPEYGEEKKALEEAFTESARRKSSRKDSGKKKSLREDYVKPVKLSVRDMLSYGHKPWDPDYGEEKKGLEEAFTESARRKSSRKDSGKKKSSRNDYVKPVKLSFCDMLSYGHKPGDPDYGEEKKALEEAFTEAARHKSRDNAHKQKDVVKPVKVDFHKMRFDGHETWDLDYRAEKKALEDTFNRVAHRASRAGRSMQ